MTPINDKLTNRTEHHPVWIPKVLRNNNYMYNNNQFWFIKHDSTEPEIFGRSRYGCHVSAIFINKLWKIRAQVYAYLLPIYAYLKF